MPNYIDLAAQNYATPNDPTSRLQVDPTQYVTTSPYANLGEDILLGGFNTLIDGFNEVFGTNIPDATTIVNDVENFFGGFNLGGGSLIGQLISAAEGTAEGLLGEFGQLFSPIINIAETIENTIEQIPIINLILRLLGLAPSGGGGGGGGGGGTTPPPVNVPPDLTLAQFLGLLGTDTQITSSQLQGLAPAASKNVLADPSFDTSNYFQGQGEWCWDGWTNAIRTVRPGLITVYVAVGAPGGVFDSDFDLLGYLGDSTQNYMADGYLMTELDTNSFETVYVPYSTGVAMQQSVQQAVDWTVATIGSIPGPFILVGNGQGALVMSGVYDQIRYGNLQYRRNDLLAGVMFGNPRREEGVAFPGYNPPPGTSGCVVDCASIGPYTDQGDPSNAQGGNLIDTEGLWWELPAPNDLLTCCPVEGSAVLGGPPSWMTAPRTGQPMLPTDSAIIDEMITVAMGDVGEAPGVVIGISGPMGDYYQSYGSGITVDDHFRFGSVTKGLTSTAILKAVGDELLSLDDTLDMYVPTMPNADTITIREMLMQTSGVFDTEQNTNLGLQFTVFPNTYFSNANLLSVIEGGAPNALPGVEWFYTESNFILLGFVLEAIYPDDNDAQVTITNNVLVPGGLTQSGWVTTSAGVGLAPPAPAATEWKNSLLSYIGLGGGRVVQSSCSASVFWTAGAAYGTIGDLLKFGKLSGSGVLLDAAVQQQRMTTFTSPTVTPMESWVGATGPATYQEWGLGWFQDGSWVGNDGSVPGSSCCVMYEPSTGTTIAVAENFQTSAPYVLNALSQHWFNMASYLLPGSTGQPGYSPGSAQSDHQVTNLVDGEQFRTFFHNVMQNYTGSNLSAAGGGAPLVLENYYIGNSESPQSPSAYFYGQPLLAATGDSRTYAQIAVDYINSFAGGSHPDGTRVKAPPVNGIRHQICGQRFAVVPGQEIIAGASAMWTNVFYPGDAILLCVNAYDADNNLIATIGGSDVVPDATVSNPLPNSGWSFVPLQDAFVMPPEAATACIVFDVEAPAMAPGIVWFKDAVFEVTSTIAGWAIDPSTLAQLTGEQVSGPQGIANVATALQNMWDDIASGATQTSMTGTQYAQAMQALAEMAANSATALQLGVNNSQVLSPSNTPLYNGLQTSGEVTFPLRSFTAGEDIATVSVTSGSALLGFITCQQSAKKGFIEFMANGVGGTGVYVNVYDYDTSTGDFSILWSSADISSLVPNGSLGWVPINIATDDAIQVTAGQVVAIEIVAQSTTISVAAETIGIPNHVTHPPNYGATRNITVKGVSPVSLTEANFSFGGTEPYISFGISADVPLYQPPSVQKWEAAGQYEFTLPTYLNTGDLIDAVLLGAGGAGGDSDGTYLYIDFFGFILANGYLSGGNGQGGMGGAWATGTFEIGTDIPSNITDLTLLVGNPGSAPSGAGGNTVLGYNFDSPPEFRSIEGGNTQGKTLTWVQTADVGDCIIVFLDTGWGTFDVTCAETTMIPIGLAYLADSGSQGALAAYYLMAPESNPEISVTLANAVYFTVSSIAVADVSVVGLVSAIHGSGATLSQDVVCGSNQIVLHAFANHGAQLSSFDGGTHELYDFNPSGASCLQGISVSLVTEDDTITATASVADAWAGMAIALYGPGTVLLQASGGQPGGPGGAANYNPANSNQSSLGQSAGTKNYQGKPYFSGPVTTATHLPGNAPAGGSAGGDVYVPDPSPGAQGKATLTARRGAVNLGGVGGGPGTGGSQFSVTYEATGAGGEESTSGAISKSWQHPTSGGPNCGMILIGAVDFYNGSISINANCGSQQFVYTLASVEYYNSGGYGLFLFALGLIGPPSGNPTVTLSAAGSATVEDIAGNTISYQNVGGFGDFYASSGVGTSLALNGVPGGAGQIIAGGFAGLGQVISGFNHTQRWQQAVTASVPMLLGDTDGSSGADFTATMASDSWGGVFGSILPIS